jgi:hypothetical protein
MRFARSYIKYLYSMRRHPHDWANWHGEGNIGDAIQCIAIERLLTEFGIAPETLVHINRDALSDYAGEPCVLPMQGWFGYFADVFPFPWAKNITPFFTGFHLTSTWESRERFVKSGIPALMKPLQPIGCRDRSTMLFLRSQGLNAYLSGCLTLTFPRRETAPDNGKVFLVDIPEHLQKRFPLHILGIGDESITHFHYFHTYPVTEEGATDYENQARIILERYRKEARLVITSRVHTALPCLGMGIPVIFVTDKDLDERFDVLTGLIPVYNADSLESINWAPEPIDVEFLQCLQKKVFASTLRALSTSVGVAFQGAAEPISPQLLSSFEMETDRRQLGGLYKYIKYKADIEQKSKELLALSNELRSSRRWKIGNSIGNLRFFFKSEQQGSNIVDRLEKAILELYMKEL